jgi:CRISPR/Cas system-associated exonuclease Cas4 (RecB family)
MLDSYSEAAEEFEAEVAATLREIFNRSTPLKQCEDDSACKYCDYQTICNRE